MHRLNPIPAAERPRKRVAAILISAPILAGALILGGGSAAWAAPDPTTIDQVNDTNTNGSIVASASQVTAQTFIAGRTGLLTAIDIDLAGNGGPGATLQVRSVDGTGTPTSTVLSTAAIIPAASGWTTETLDTPVAVTQGTVYAFTFIVPPGTSDPNDPFPIQPQINLVVNPNGYADGSTFVLAQPPQNIGFLDLYFRTYVALPSASSAPTAVAAALGATQGTATVSWTTPTSNGGSAITSYTVTASGGGGSCTTATTSCTITGLVAGRSYTFTVAATNATGTSAASAASNAVTVPAAAIRPAADPAATLPVTGVNVNPFEVGGAGAAILLGILLMLVARVRRRRSN